MLLKYNNHNVVKTQPFKVDLLQHLRLGRLQTQGWKNYKENLVLNMGWVISNTVVVIWFME